MPPAGRARPGLRHARVRARRTERTVGDQQGAAAARGRRSSGCDNAAQAAGCELRSPRNEGAAHESREFTAADYRSNPPTSGTHFPQWAADGVYEPGTTPPLGELVHALEHGRVQLQYAEDAAPETPARLRLLVDELEGGYHLLLFQNRTGMPYAVAATAWDQLIGCPAMNEQVFDALRAFRNTYVDKAPEVIP